MANTHSLDLERGSNQKASAPDSASLSITSSWSYEAWYKFESHTGTSRLFDKTPSTGLNGYGAYWHTDNKIYPRNANASAADELGFAFTPTDAVWYHIAITFDDTANECKVYIDGSLVATQTYNLAPTDNAVAFVIGGQPENTGQEFDGIVDDVRLWNDVRTATEISDNKNTELVGNEAGLVAYWKLNNNGNDETANANNLTVNTGTFVTDVPSWPPADMNISVSDAVVVAESKTITLIHNVSVSDAVAIAESITITNTALGNISVSDAVATVESVTLLFTNSINVSDAVAIAESITITNTALGNVSVSDAIAIAESVNLVFVSLINVSDSVTVAESVTITNTALGDISVSDAIAIAESVTITNTALGNISVSDAIAIAESVTITNTALGNISVSDAIAIAESTSFTGQLGNINVSDAVAVAESKTLTITPPATNLVYMRSDQQLYPIPLNSDEQSWPKSMDDSAIS